jgi:hypothetical protein
MGASISLSRNHKIMLGVVCFIVVVAVLLGALGGAGLFSGSGSTATPTPEPGPNIIDVSIGSSALFSPTNNGQLWKTVSNRQWYVTYR